jgi:CubicO group peptidase (beta-lactamase class C family)
MPISRRQFIQLGAQAAAIATASRFFVADAFAQTTGAFAPVHDPLDRFIEQYLRAMGAPGMTLVLADRAGVQRVASYGFDDVEHAKPIAPDALFQIGSISKSFTAICLLQLHEEGKLDLDKPILDYLPWLRIESTFAPITVHDMLTHGSGLPDNGPLLLSDPQARHRAAYAPGQHFHYCNAAYQALGHLVWTLDGRPLAEVLRKRIFEPLAMNRTEPHISFDLADRMVKSYWAPIGDRPYPQRSRLGEAPGIVDSGGAGCIASTAEDMGRYIRMLAGGGQGPNGRLLSKESFALFAKPHIKSDEFGPTASYGYGIVVDTLDAHRILRHTGGMVSFASALHVDIDEGIGAFASINAMQGFRPTEVVEYATRLMRAQRDRKALPSPPPQTDPATVENAADYAGVYHGADGRSLEFVADGERLFLMHASSRVPVHAKDDFGLAMHPDLARFFLLFGRADPKKPKSAVVEVSWGGDWYTNASYGGPKAFEVPAPWQAYVGHYRNESVWVGSLRIVIHKGRLTIDGAVPLEPGEAGLFHLRDEEHSPEWISFHEVVNGKAMRIKFSGEDLWREMVA